MINLMAAIAIKLLRKLDYAYERYKIYIDY